MHEMSSMVQFGFSEPGYSVSYSDSDAEYPGCDWTASSAIGVARILSGVHFFFPKSWRPFFSRRPQRPSRNIPPNLTRPAKTILKIDSCSRWGCTSCPGGALTHFPCKLRLKKNFHPWGCRCTHRTPWLRLWVRRRIQISGLNSTHEVYWLRLIHSAAMSFRVSSLLCRTCESD